MKSNQKLKKYAGSEMRNSNLMKQVKLELKKENFEMGNIEEIEAEAQSYNHEMSGNRYRHFKGNIYVVNHVGINTRDLTLVVVYHEQYRPFITWCRPLEEFLSPVDHEKYPDIKQQYRFEKL